MAVNLSIKNVPEEWVARLREIAARQHRSLQGELMACLEEHIGRRASITVDQLLGEVRALGLATPAESKKIIRADRNGRKGR